MKRLALVLLALAFALPTSTVAQQGGYDYWAPQREMVARGVQAILGCNGIFTSNRSVDLVYEQEFAYLSRFPRDVGTPDDNDMEIDWARKAVAVGTDDGTPIMRAAFRDGIGCVIMAPDQTFDDIDQLPIHPMPPLAGDPATIAWPDGDLVADMALPRGVDAAALQTASDWAFDRDSEFQVTLSLVVVHNGEIVHERYAPGVDMNTKTRTWSTAKSVAVTLIGMLVDEGKLFLDEPVDLPWLPNRNQAPEGDPRNQITLRNLLNMSSGLETVDNGGMEYATGSGLAYWAGFSSVQGALSRALIREPGTSWDYENYDTLLGVLAMKRAIGDDEAYLTFPRRRLFDKIGMRSTFPSTDRFGDFIFSSQVYTNARDLARLGLLYLNGGVWHGERLISEEFIDFVRTPAPATAERGNQYGGQWWLVPDNRDDVPSDAYSTAGNRGQYTLVVPSHDLVIVRRGLDWGRQGFNRWDLVREVVKAFEPETDGN